MEAARALAELTEISPQIQAAVIFDESGVVEGSTLADEERSRRIARLGRELLEAAGRVRAEAATPVTQVQAELRAGSVFLVRAGERAIAATTGGEPTVGLVFYDLRSCLRSLGEEEHAAT